MELTRKVYSLAVEKADDQGGKRIISAVVSSEIIDRDGDIITAAAMKAAMAEYMKNPVILAGHQHRLTDGKSPVVGRVINWRQEGKKTICDVEFVDTELGLEYWQLYSGKFQRGFSIGFKIISYEEKYIDGKRVNVITEIMLYEISAVGVPANQDALSKSAKRRLDFVESKRAAAAESLVDIFNPSGIDLGDECDCKGLDLDLECCDYDPFTMEPLQGCPTKGLYSEGGIAQGGSFSGDGGPCGADLGQKTLGFLIQAKERSEAEAFGSEKLYRRYKKYLDEKSKRYSLSLYTCDEIELFDAIEKHGIEAVIKNGGKAPVEEGYEQLFLR